MIFSSENGLETITKHCTADRYATYDEALAGHEKLAKSVESLLNALEVA